MIGFATFMKTKASQKSNTYSSRPFGCNSPGLLRNVTSVYKYATRVFVIMTSFFISVGRKKNQEGCGVCMYMEKALIRTTDINILLYIIATYATLVILSYMG